MADKLAQETKDKAAKYLKGKLAREYKEKKTTFLRQGCISALSSIRGRLKRQTQMAAPARGESTATIRPRQFISEARAILTPEARIKSCWTVAVSIGGTEL
jgi:hypothetical protein